MPKGAFAKYRSARLAAGATFCLLAASALGQGCVPIKGLETGPHDYRNPPADVLYRVEKFHFNSDVEMLRKGESTVKIGEDLEFVLRYFPNHHRALNSMLKLAMREKTNLPRGNRDTVDCWFERAIVFRPDDGTSHLLYALWLVSRGGKKEAVQELERAQAYAPEGNANFQYNMGLAYLDVGDYDRALQAAHAAYALGYPLPGLRDRLQRANKWRPAPQPSVPSAAGAPAPLAGESAPPPAAK